MTAIILTGGKKPLICDLYPGMPTSLIPVLNQPFLYWVTHWVKAQGFTQIVYAASQHADMLDIWVDEASNVDHTLCLDVVKEPQPLGTGAATANCAKRFPSDIFLVVTGETLLPVNLSNAIEKMKTNPAIDGIILGTPKANAGRFGELIIDDNHYLRTFNEKATGHGLVNVGVYLLRQSLLEQVQTDIELNLESDCFPTWLQAGKTIKVMDVQAPFIEIGTAEALQKANKQIEQYKSLIMNPITEVAV